MDRDDRSDDCVPHSEAFSPGLRGPGMIRARLHSRLRRRPGRRSRRQANYPVHRSRGTAAKPQRVLRLRRPGDQGDKPIGLGGRPLRPPQPHRDTRAAGGAVPNPHAPGPGFGPLHGLVRSSGACLYSAWFDRRGRGPAPRRARRDRDGRGLDGVAERVLARSHRRSALGRVRPPGGGDGRGRAGETGAAEASTHPRCQDGTGRQRDGSGYLPDPRGWRVAHRRR